MAFDAERAGRAFLGQNEGDTRAALASVDEAEERFQAADIDRAEQLQATREWLIEQHQAERQPGDIEFAMVDGRPMKRLPFASGWTPLAQ